MKLLRYFRIFRSKAEKPQQATAPPPEKSDSGGVEYRHRMRIQSCLETILDANECFSVSALDTDLVAHFESLKKAIENLDAAAIQERDLRRIEEATNRLLRDMKSLIANKRIEKDVSDPPPVSTH